MFGLQWHGITIPHSSHLTLIMACATFAVYLCLETPLTSSMLAKPTIRTIDFTIRCLTKSHLSYPLVNCYITMENHHV